MSAWATWHVPSGSTLRTRTPSRHTSHPCVYRTAYGANLRRGATISRADVADVMLRSVGDAQSYRTSLGVAY